MPTKWLGISNSSDKVEFVALVQHEDGVLVVDDEGHLKLASGDRADAYRVLAQRVRDYVKNNAVHHVVLQGSATSGFGMTRGGLHSAELRGVVTVAVAETSCRITGMGTFWRTVN